MAEKNPKGKVDLKESSIYGTDDATTETSSDAVDDGAIDRLEEMVGNVDDEPRTYGGELGRRLEDLDASTEEEVEALEVNLLQDDDTAGISGGTGRISDDIARERLAEFTEVGPDLAGEGAVSLAPGREDRSNDIRQRHPNTEIARSETVGEGNFDESRDEARGERKVDEGTAA